MRRIVTAVSLTTMLLFALPAVAGEEPLSRLLADGDYDAAVAEVAVRPDHYLAELIAEANRLQLDRDPAWLALMHYRKRPLGGYLSEVDGTTFFTSRRGQTDPRQELSTTLASFFSTRPVPPSIHTPQCRFLARYTWLKQRLHFDPTRMDEQGCEPYDIFYKAAEPVGLTVVFPSTHPNSPSSMFGHTLLRIDSRGHSGASRMLDYTINYAAQADTSNSLAYAVKGLAGGFEGRFRVVPYHMKLREYAQMENRDIWEYQLDVPQHTVDMVLMHAWELLGTHFDYYFFTENCSYHVLTLLESDLYEHDLIGNFRWWVLPTDTLRVLDENHLVRKVDYYPSSYRTILARRANLSDPEDALAQTIYRDGPDAHGTSLASLPLDRQAAVLDMAYDYLRYRKIAASDVLSPELGDRERNLLIARSRLRVTTPTLDVPAPSTRPDQGHGTTRFTIGAGVDDDGGFVKLGWRGVYHGWLDPAAGYSSNFALEFGRLDLRYYTGKPVTEGIKLDDLYLINLDNFEPLDAFFRRISWHVTTGWESVFNAADDRDTAFMVRGGPGVSFRPANASWLGYVGADVEAAYSDAFRADYYVGAGPAMAVMQDVTDAWRLSLTGRYLAGVAADDHRRASFAFDQSWRVNTNAALNLGLAWQRKLDGWNTEASVWLNVYY